MSLIKHAFEFRFVVLVVVFFSFLSGISLGAAPQQVDRNAQSYVSSAISAQQAGHDSDPELLAMAPESAEDKAELQNLLSVLQEETEVATKTRINDDYVPGMVTVLRGDELEALGIRTAAEALTLVPGIQLSLNASGNPSVKVRGFQYPFNAGNIKVLLNSVPLSRESSGIDSSVLLIPVEQIDRIEVIRGPGSSIYGDFAMTGVVNIITRDNGRRLFVVADDRSLITGGGNYTYRNPQNSFGAGLNISMTKDGEGAGAVGTDPDEKQFLPVLQINYKGFSLIGEGVFRDIKLGSGPAGAQDRPPPGLPPPGSPPPPTPPPTLDNVSFNEKTWVIEGRQSFDLGRNASAEAHLFYLRNSWDAKRPVSEFHGDQIEAELNVHWSPWSRHQFLLGLSYSYSDIDNALNQPPNLPATTISGVYRRSYSLGVQDQITLNDRLSTTLGLRFDHYSDVGSLLTPRVAFVYRLAERHLIKAQYSQGFRAPTFWELYSTGTADRSLDFEVLKTTEFSYIYRRPTAVARVTLYYSKIGNVIYAQPGGGYGNTKKIESKGVEVEWEQQISEKFRWLANLSYNDTSDNRSAEAGDHALGVADWLGNIAFFLKPAPRMMLTGRLLYVGNRHAPDGWIDGYKIVDFTLSRMDLLKKGLTLRAGIKNIFNDNVVYVTDHPTQLLEDTFSGRTIWAQLSYEF